MAFESKKIAVAVTGGIAAYKTCEIIRELKKSGAEVRVAMTESARRFVSDLTFATLSEHPVATSLFEESELSGITHIDLARWCDALLICPATANIIGKVAAGLADDIVSTTIMATKAPVVFCPAMNSAMWQNGAVRSNVEKLLKLRYEFVEPEWGELATRSEGEGWGRLASNSRIVQKLKQILLSSKDLVGEKVVVTAGATREPIDPVRFITNYSSGKMGFALAEAAKLKGADVVLIAGSNQLSPIEGVKYIAVNTADEMKSAVATGYKNASMLLMAAAVSDYRPKHRSPRKIKKSDDVLTLELEKNVDILAELGKQKADCIHVGFALETDNGLNNATQKLHQKNLDLVILNDPLEPGAGFSGDTNVVTLISSDGTIEKLPKLPKFTIANIILERVSKMRQLKNKHAAAV
jgi:phosphopantothenoylcysteine decarboxylase/phosphopantothenate--cysteine ligase